MAGLSRVRFKYLFGEMHLASWRPQLQVAARPADATAADWPAVAELSGQDLEANADGYWCQQLPLDRFPLGIGRLGSWIRYVPRLEKLHYVDLSGDFDGYLSRWSSKARYNLKRSVRKLTERNPDGVLETFASAASMESFLKQAAAISQTTYQSRLLQSGLGFDPALVRRMEVLAERGEGRGYLLRDQGRAIAFAWCAGSGERMTYEVIGYLEEAAALSPGAVLLYLIIEDLFSLQRFKMFDFGVGDAPYKQQFGTHTLEFADAYLFKPCLKNWLRVWAHWRLDGLSAGIGGLLDRFGLKSKVRRLLRLLAPRGG